MKKLLLAFILISPALWAQEKASSIEFEDGEKQKVITIKSDEKIRLVDIFKLKNLNLENVLKAMDVDSTERDKAVVLIAKDGNVSDTLLVINRAGNEIKIVARDLKGIFQTEDSDEIWSFEPDEAEEERSYGQMRKRRSQGNYFSRTKLAFYVGLNNYTNAPNEYAELRAWPSKYVSLGYHRNLTLGKTENTHTVFAIGPEFSWNNFMLVNSNKLNYENGQSEFIPNSVATTKSKFLVPHFTLPGMVRVGFKKAKFNIGVGAYVGYRTGGRTKEKLVKPRVKNVQKEQVAGVSNLKYGLAGEFGRRNMSLFVRYDLSPLFKDTQTQVKDMHAFSFGVRLF